MVALAHTDVNKFERAGRNLLKNQCGLDAQTGKGPVYANELPDNAVTVNGTVRHPKRNFTEAEIQSLVTNYRDNGLTVYQLADKYGCHRNTISKVLRQNGVEVTIRKLNEERLKQAIELYGAGWSLREIGRELDVTKSTVRVALVKAEVEMREAKRCKVNGNMLDSG